MHKPRLVLTTAASFALLASAASAATPTVINGNPSCTDIDPSYKEFKVDTGNPGTYQTGNGLTGTITIAGGSVSFDVTPGVDAALIKGGTEANLYSYDPAATSDSGLVPPTNPNTGQPYGISHVTLCVGAPKPPAGGGGTPQSPDPAPQPSPQPTPDSTPGSTPAPTGTSQVLGATATGGPTGTIKVKPAVVVSGASRLSGPSGCVSKAFKVKITGRRIASVTFRIDGRKVKTMKKGFALTIKPAKYGPGLHRVAATVRYVKASQTKSRTHRYVFERCARQTVAPQFTG